MDLRFVLCALLLIGCSTGGDADDPNEAGNAGKGSKPSNPSTPPEPTRKLMLSTTVVHLEFGARLQIRGHLGDAKGKPVADALVSFALVGHPEDSSVDMLDARTDAKGGFQNALSAGQRASTFRVRVSAEDTAEGFIDVAVSDAGFGSLLVGAEYQGAREVVQRSVFAQAGRSCVDEGNARREGDPIATLSEGQQEARLPALPAGIDYAVTALAYSELGTLVARGCVDGVEVDTDSETAIEVAFTDEPLARAGQFMLQAELDASGPASVLNTVLSSAALVQIDGDVLGAPPPVDAEGVFLLDALDAVLRSKGNAQPAWVDLADALEADRDAVPAEGEPTTDHTLQAQLGFDEKGPRAAIPYMAQLVQDNLAQMRLSVALVLVPTGGEAATLQPLRIEALPALEDAAPVSIDLTAIDIAATTSSAAFLPERDVLDVSRLRFRGQLGALAIQVLRRTLRVQDEGGALEPIRELLGCAVLSDWLGARDDASACSEGCVVAACDHALAALRGAAESALRAIDEARPNVVFSGEFALHDDDGDLTAETLKCDEFEGEWQAEKKGTADVIVGKASAAPLVTVE